MSWLFLLWRAIYDKEMVVGDALVQVGVIEVRI